MGKGTVLIITLSKYLKTAVEDIAEKKGESQANIVREAIREKIEKVGYIVKDKKK